ncbi:hypothetical protein [Nocardia jiangxiensis]|uniref:hypothetical protein n=1 Tax=Nocardia jiangxiensis TaxID=282685 RepID=UPI0002F12425|nr:hypothetical protein [Nocardia jiangxiensis]
MTIAVAQRSTGNTSSAGTSYSVTLPNTSANTGDLYLVFVTTPSAATLSTSSAGWSIAGTWGAASGIYITLFTGEQGPVSSLTVTSSASVQAAWASLRLTGAWPGGGIAVASATGSSTSPTSPALTPPLGNISYQWLIIDAGTRPTFYDPTGAPSGWSNYQSANTGTSGVTTDAFIASAELNAIASSQTPGAWTGVTFAGTYTALTVAIPSPTIIHQDNRLSTSVTRSNLY